MFKYFILRKQQQLFCYFCGIVLAMVLMLLFPSVFRGSGFYLLLSSVALFWAGLALYTRHIDRMRKPEVSPLVSIRDGNQVVAEVPRHEKARLEWEIFRDDEVFRQQRWELTGLTGRVISRGLLYTPAVMLVGRHCCKVSDEAAFCLIQRPYISKTLLTRRISPRGSP